MRISDWSSDVCSSDLSCLCEVIRRVAVPNATSPLAAKTDAGGDATTDLGPVVAAPRPITHQPLTKQAHSPSSAHQARKSAVEGKSVSVRVALGGRRSIKIQ